MTPIVDVIPGSPAHVRACIAAGNHDRVKADRALWESLKFDGYMMANDRPVLELRTCVCTSTLAIRMEGQP